MVICGGLAGDDVVDHPWERLLNGRPHVMDPLDCIVVTCGTCAVTVIATSSVFRGLLEESQGSVTDPEAEGLSRLSSAGGFGYWKPDSELIRTVAASDNVNKCGRPLNFSIVVNGYQVRGLLQPPAWATRLGDATLVRT